MATSLVISDFFDSLDMIVCEYDFDSLLKDRAEAEELLKFLKEEGYEVPDDLDVDEFIEEWNFFVCVNNEEVLENGRPVDRVYVMSDAEIARAIRECHGYMEDLYEYVFDEHIDRDEVVEEWAENYEEWH